MQATEWSREVTATVDSIQKDIRTESTLLQEDVKRVSEYQHVLADLYAKRRVAVNNHRNFGILDKLIKKYSSEIDDNSQKLQPVEQTLSQKTAQVAEEKELV